MTTQTARSIARNKKTCHNQLLAVNGVSDSTHEAGLLASGSSYWPRLPANHVAVAYAAVVPGYSGGTATDLHRLPYSFRQQRTTGTPGVSRAD